MVWKMTIMSRGVTPSELRAWATFSTVGSSGRAIIWDLFSVTSVLVLGVTTVCPRSAKGCGCEAVRVEAMLMVMLPWETAQVEILIREVATTDGVDTLIEGFTDADDAADFTLTLRGAHNLDGSSFNL